MKPIRDPKTGAMVLPPQLFTSMKKSRVGLKGTYSLSLSLSRFSFGSCGSMCSLMRLVGAWTRWMRSYGGETCGRPLWWSEQRRAVT